MIRCVLLADAGGEVGGEVGGGAGARGGLAGVGGVEQAAHEARMPTITPSAYAATSAAWAPLRTPSPTADRQRRCAARTRATSAGATLPRSRRGRR